MVVLLVASNRRGPRGPSARYIVWWDIPLITTRFRNRGVRVSYSLPNPSLVYSRKSHTLTRGTRTANQRRKKIYIPGGGPGLWLGIMAAGTSKLIKPPAATTPIHTGAVVVVVVVVYSMSFSTHDGMRVPGVGA